MTMQWKNGRQLSQVKTSKDTITYKYNNKGLRTRKDNSDYTYYYYYDDNNNLIAMMQGGVVAYFYYDSNNSVTAMSINDSMYYYVKNLQGDSSTFSLLFNDSKSQQVWPRHAHGVICGFSPPHPVRQRFYPCPLA